MGKAGKLAALAAVVIVLCGCMPRDNSDTADSRSGFSVFTDALTGCQYVGWGEGYKGKAITPRMNADGRQICGGAQ